MLQISQAGCSAAGTPGHEYIAMISRGQVLKLPVESLHK